jgi:hypothetical protein
MKLEINTTEKTIKILEDISAKELLSLADTILNFDEYKIIQSKEFVYQQIYPQFYYEPYKFPIITTTEGSTVTTSSGSGNITFYRYNHD